MYIMPVAHEPLPGWCLFIHFFEGPRLPIPVRKTCPLSDRINELGRRVLFPLPWTFPDFWREENQFKPSKRNSLPITTTLGRLSESDSGFN